MSFQPDYQNLVNAAYNRKSTRIPLYEHNISASFMERITGEKFAYLSEGDDAQKRDFFKKYNAFQRDMGYDAVTFEYCIGSILINGGALGGHKEGAIQCREDFEKYPWEILADRYVEHAFPYFRALRDTMPEGMKAVGGVGNGVFEIVQDLTGFMGLCYIKADDEELFRDLFSKVGDVMTEIWTRFLAEFSDLYCVCRFGDDLGFKSTTLLAGEDVKTLIVPQYKRIVDMVHQHNLPFLLHSCGCIFNVLDEIIEVAGIDAKHSNEDAISPYKKWLDDYGDRIGNFGGLDTDVLCDLNTTNIVAYTEKIFQVCVEKGHGIAIGSGNSIPDYVSVPRYLKAVETIRRLRGE